MDWVTGDLCAIAKDLKKFIKLPSDKSKEAAKAKKHLADMELDSPRLAADSLEHLFLNNTLIHGQMREFMLCALEKRMSGKLKPAKSIFPRGFKSLFNLDEDSLKIIAFAWGMSNFRPLEKLFEDDLHLTSLENLPVFSHVLGIAQPKLTRLRLMLTNQGILDEDYADLVRVTDNINNIFNMGRLGKIEDFFCKSPPVTDVPLELFQISDEEKRHALALMRRKCSAPAHLLLYGPPGTGKTSFASQIARQLNARAWSVCCNEKDTGKDRRVSLTACLNMALNSPGSIIIVDEAEKMLNTGFDDSSSSKAWLNELMEKKGIKVIWITNEVGHIDQAVRRRFSFSIQFQSLGARESRQMWTNVAERLKVEDRFPAEARERFARTYPVPVAVMENVARQAKALSGKRNFCECAELILKSHMRLKNDGAWAGAEKRAFENYNPLAVSSSVPAEKLAARLKSLRERMSQGPLPGMGNILFYGPPGTGKTAFAHYLAETLEMEPVTERASGILGSYVGETERRIAEVFGQAQRYSALLIIDEVDSFLSSREGAVRSWEQTMVNEFLTALENHCGLCVCTTNFRKIIDNAAMRRFPFKVEFCYSSPERSLLLYDSMLAPLTEERLAGSAKEKLCSLKYLAPGDFKTVLSQFWLEDPKEVSCAQLVEALAKEQKLKLDNESRAMGFDL